MARMPDSQWFDGLSARQAVEEAAHEMRNHQLHIIGMAQLLQRMNMGDLDGQNLVPPLSPNEGLSQIQQSVREISDCMDALVDYLRQIDDTTSV
jgi:predicted component of type VI protein secretion system